MKNWTENDFFNLAKLIKVDEVYVFNDKGVIINGSRSQYYGYSMDEGEQIAYFKPMLVNKKLRMCQDVTPNSAEGKPMMYAAVWDRERNFIVQVGITPERLLARMSNNEINNLISKIPVTKGMNIYVVDEFDKTIIGSTDDVFFGTRLNEEDILQSTMEDGERVFASTQIQGKQCYMVYERMGKYDIAVSCSIEAANSSLLFSLMQFLLILMIAFFLINFITKRYIKEIQKQTTALEEANAAKTMFLSRMSHDIRTPLNGILGLLEISERNKDNKEIVDSNRDRTKLVAEHLLSLLNDALEVTKLDDSNVVLSHKCFNVGVLLDEVYSISCIKADENAIKLSFNTDNTEISKLNVNGSPLHVRQILLNIIDNCIKYNKPNGTVDFSVNILLKDEKNVVLRFVISDTGIGMSEEFLKHIFEPFSQEKSDARSVFKGTGLGMSIVKALVDRMDGIISITSVENEGSTFEITIPFELSDEKTVAKELEHNTEENSNRDISGCRLLLVEDNELNRDVAKTLLEEHGVEVFEVPDGKCAVEAFSNSETGFYDIILMDILMPVMNGIDAAKAIRNMERQDAKQVPIIALSANTYDEDIQESINAGMNEHIAKPFKINNLVDIIAKYINK